MNTSFTKTIQDREFKFQPLEIPDRAGYSVSVKDEEGNQWEFRLFADDDHRYTIEGEHLPEWLPELEDQLNEAVNAHE